MRGASRHPGNPRPAHLLKLKACLTLATVGRRHLVLGRALDEHKRPPAGLGACVGDRDRSSVRGHNLAAVNTIVNTSHLPWGDGETVTK